MAVYNKFEIFSEDLLKKVHDCHTDTIRIYLANTIPSASGDAIKTDLAEISAGNGYTAGGNDTQNTVSRTGLTSSVNAVDITITATGGSIGPFQWVPLYNDIATPKVDPLIAWWDYGSALTLASGETFTVDFGSNKLFDLV